ncbi:MAG: hypothetical protein M0003_07765 [Acidithiobacillus sp.]|nr:hypothetical protein [Acidithiobacillus sp.]
MRRFSDFVSDDKVVLSDVRSLLLDLVLQSENEDTRYDEDNLLAFVAENGVRVGRTMGYLNIADDLDPDEALLRDMLLAVDALRIARMNLGEAQGRLDMWEEGEGFSTRLD